MSNEIRITAVGNLTSDPELRFSTKGTAVANFSVACTPRTFDRSGGNWVDGDVSYLRVSVFGDTAEHVAESLHKGNRVIVMGKLQQGSYVKDGQKVQTWTLIADAVGPDLAFATAEVKRATRKTQREVAA